MTFMPMRIIGNEINESVTLSIDLKYKQLLIYFSLADTKAIEKPDTAGNVSQYRIKVPLSHLNRFLQTQDRSGCVSHSTILDSPPFYHRRIKDKVTTFSDKNSWREADTWFRQTCIVHNPEQLSSLPAGIQRRNPVVDIGESHGR